MDHKFIFRKTGVLLIIFTIGVGFLYPTKTYAFEFSTPFDLPIVPHTFFYLTATPKNHSKDNNRAAIDFQIADEFGFIDRGAPLYAPFDGSGIVTISPNKSVTLELTSNNGEWKLIFAHIENSSRRAQLLNQTYPKHVVKGEIIAYQGNSGFDTKEQPFPVHVHFEVFKKIKESGEEYSNKDEYIHLCRTINLEYYCNYIDNNNRLLFITDRF
jgi:murein DD-endopeptidase MepM/ murein hydrolase activator NlpD